MVLTYQNLYDTITRKNKYDIFNLMQRRRQGVIINCAFMPLSADRGCCCLGIKMSEEKEL